MLRDYDSNIAIGSVVFYDLVPFHNHSRVQYRRKYRASLSCDVAFMRHMWGWIFVKTGIYLWD